MPRCAPLSLLTLSSSRPATCQWVSTRVIAGKARTAEAADEQTTMPVSFNMKVVKVKNVKIKLWDLGGQARFRSMWTRYARGANAILCVSQSATQSYSTPSAIL